MDLDIEMGDGLDMVQEKYDHELPSAEDILQPDEPEEPGEVAEDEPQANADLNDASKTIVPTKIHIRGLDTLHTDDIKAYVKAHYGIVDRVEWIDDSSANLSFPSAPAARDAIAALSSIQIADATALTAGESLPAKPLDGRPEISLYVRFAVESDRKQAGAALRSRYYLLHPEHDPEERRRRQHEGRSRYRERDRDGNRDRDRDHRRRSGRRRDDSEERESFQASMYDDAPRPRPQRDARSPEIDERPARSHGRENQGKELFADRSSRRDRAARERDWDRERERERDRSASPRRNRDTDDRRSDDEAASSSRNRVKARSIKERLAADNKSKELFPSQRSTSRFGGGQLDELERSIGSAHLKETDMPRIVAIPDAHRSNGSSSLNIRGVSSQRGNAEFSIKGTASTASAKELFPGRFGAGNAGKELMSKRRQRAEDLFS